MRKSLSSLALVSLILPALTLAFDYSDSSRDYSDAPFSRAEAAGISVLSNLNVVQGNPDGSFRPGRTLNRAEFTKIALEIWRIHNDMPFSDRSWKTNCFPDVQGDVWYADPVCRAKELGIVQGNPDGFFRPERPVNYAEALKMLGEIFDVKGDVSPGSQWYAVYARGAMDAGVALPNNPAYDRFLTRGEMARLSAAYLAESEGELEMYRAAEHGERASSSSSSLSSSSSSVSSVSSSSSSISSASSVSSSSSSLAANAPDLPARSRFLVLGERSEPIGALKFFADKEAIFVRTAKVVLEREIDSIDAMFLIDENGVEIGQLSLDKVYDSTEKTWRGSFPSAGAYRLPKAEERMLAIEVRLKPRGQGGGSDQLVEIDQMEIVGQGEDSGSNYSALSYGIIFPKHQTSQGRITAVSNTMDMNESLPVGMNQLLGAFAFEGAYLQGADLAVKTLEFQVSKSASITLSDYQIGTGESADRYPCTISDSVISCSNIPAAIGSMSAGSRTLRLFADVAYDGTGSDPFLQISLNQPGAVGTNGAVQWSDGSATFYWIEMTAPIARGPRFD